MADDIRQIQIGDPTSLVSGSVTVDNTTRAVTANLTALSGILQVPVTITAETIDPNGNVAITGNAAGLGQVSVTFNEANTTANATLTTALGSTSVTVAVTIVCFCSGTLIRTSTGDVAVEDLRIGDTVVTASGKLRPIRWIGRRDYAGRFVNTNPDLLPVCIRAGAVGENLPARDLWVSPKHALFLDGVLIPAASLLNGVSVVKADRVDTLTYWHVELDSHDVLLAENLPAESFVNDCGRSLFHNAASFHELYPDAIDGEAVYVAPRVEAGHVLEGVRRRINERAGLATATPKFGALHGEIDAFDGTRVSGWAQDDLYPTAPVCLDVLVDGCFVAHVYADQPRGEAPGAGVVQNSHGFSFDLVGFAAPVGSIEVRRSADGASLLTRHSSTTVAQAA